MAGQAKGPPAVAGSGPLFLMKIGEASADHRGGVGSHCSLAGFGGGDHGGLQLGLLGGHLAAGGASGGPEGVFGSALGGLELADGCEGHGWQAVNLSARSPYCNPWRTA